MKGTIVRCLQDMVEREHGPNTWSEVLDRVPGARRVVSPNADVREEDVVSLIGAAAAVVGLEAPAFLKDGGRWWAEVYGPRVYAEYYERFGSLAGFLEGVNEIHREVTQYSPRSSPPFFEITWRGRRELVVGYRSHRSLFPLLVGIVRGLGAYFDEDVELDELTPQQLRVRWADRSAAPSLLPQQVTFGAEG